MNESFPFLVAVKPSGGRVVPLPESRVVDGFFVERGFNTLSEATRFASDFALDAACDRYYPTIRVLTERGTVVAEFDPRAL